jgi:hypothetical protein
MFDMLSIARVVGVCSCGMVAMDGWFVMGMEKMDARCGGGGVEEAERGEGKVLGLG